MPWNVTGLKLWAELTLPPPVAQAVPQAIPPIPANDVPDDENQFQEDDEDISQDEFEEDDETEEEDDEGDETIIQFDLIRFVADFELNAIPKAAMSIALGRRADNLNIISAIHTFVNQMKFRLPLKVYMQAKALSNDGVAELWPVNPDGTPKTIVIFDGLTTGSGYEKSFGAVEYYLYVTHWLDSLNFASALSRLYQPVNPDQFSFMSALVNYNTGQPQSLVGTTLSQQNFTGLVVLQDFWGFSQDILPGLTVGGLKQWFTELSSQDLIVSADIQLLAQLNNITPSFANTEAFSALMRIEPINGVYTDGVPLALNVQNDFAVNIARQMAETIRTVGFDTLMGHTLWDKLVGEFGPIFGFAVVPLVNTALIVPFIPGLRTSYITIFSTEYEKCRFDGEMPRLLRAVALPIGSSYTAGSDGTAPNAVSLPLNTIGGYFQGRTSGTILFRTMPPWLANVATPYSNTLGTAAISQAVADALHPGVTSNLPIRDIQNNFLSAKTIWNQYAQYQYITEILRGRSGRISGKLRFDIAPGSSVRIEGSKEPFIKEPFIADTLGQFQYGSVLRTSIYIDSEQGMANTSFHIAYLRDPSENADDATSIDSHPLWTKQWQGAPLLHF